MDKELELEAEKYKNQKKIIPTTELEDAISKLGFIDGATSKYVEKQKLEFTMSMLNRAKDLDLKTVYLELQQKLSEL